MPPGSPLLGRLLAVALLVALVGAAWQWLVVPSMQAWESRAATREDLLHQLDAFRRMGASRSAVESALATLEQTWRDEGLLLEATNRSRAGAALQQHVATLVAAGGGQVVRTQVLPGGDEDGLFRAAARVTLSVPVENLGTLLHALESARPYLLVDSFSITTRASERSVNAGVAATPLAVEMSVSAFADIAEGADGSGG